MWASVENVSCDKVVTTITIKARTSDNKPRGLVKHRENINPRIIHKNIEYVEYDLTNG